MEELKKTPLHSWHTAHGAKMGPFAGWDMPIQYEGIIAEHMHTRTAASVFDICHMGEFMLSGPEAAKSLAKIVTHNLDTLAPGKCRYGFLLNPDGGIIDDLIVYRLAQDNFMLVVNGAGEETDFDWIRQHLPSGLSFANVSRQTSKIDLQGPGSLAALEAVMGRTFRHLGYFSFEQADWNGAAVIVSRTGYTGELGYEIYGPAESSLALWEALLALPGVKPAGLGARDTLRLECGYPLYGHDLDTQHTPAEAGYGFLLTSQEDFIGKQAQGQLRERLIALSIPGRRSARHGDAVLRLDGSEVGRVTSGSFGPSLGHCIALAYVSASAADDASFLIRGARSELNATKTDLPFFKGGTARMKL